MYKFIAILLLLAAMLVSVFAQDAPEPITPSSVAALATIYTLEGHLDTVNNVDFSADGTVLASVSDDTALRLWSMEDGRLIGEYYEHLSFIKGLDFHPTDPTKLITSSWDRMVYVWEIDGESASVADTLQGYNAVIDHVAFSPDGEQIAFSVGDGTLRIAGADEFNVLQIVRLDALHITEVAYSPDSARVAAANGFPDSTAPIIDAETGEVLAALGGHEGAVTAIAFSPEGDIIATGGDDATVNLWQEEESIDRWVVDDWVTDLDFTPDGAVLAVALQNGRVQLWDVAQGTMIAELDSHDGVTTALRFSADGAYLATAGSDGVVRVWGVR